MNIIKYTQETLQKLLEEICQCSKESCLFCGAMRLPTSTEILSCGEIVPNNIEEWQINHFNNCQFAKIKDIESEISQKLNPILPKIELTPINESDKDQMLLQEFIEHCNNGDFIDYDGYGYYGTLTEKSNRLAIPSDIVEGKINKEFTHIYWYNR